MTLSVALIENLSGGPVDFAGQAAPRTVLKANQVTATLIDVVNASSLTDNGTGDFLFTFTNAFTTADYAIASQGSQGGVNAPAVIGGGQIGVSNLTTSLRTATVTTANVVYDSQNIGLAFWGNLA